MPHTQYLTVATMFLVVQIDDHLLNDEIHLSSERDCLCSSSLCPPALSQIMAKR